nr:mediator of RNA polymerase II transcription subunit 14 [Ipomoea batatas]
MAAALTFLHAAEESYVSLKELVEKSRSADLPDSHKKREILQYLVKTQQPLLRLNVLAKWCQQALVSLDRTSSQNPSLEQSPKPEIELLPSLAPVQKGIQQATTKLIITPTDRTSSQNPSLEQSPKPEIELLPSLAPVHKGIQQATTKLIITPTDFHMQIRNPKDICNTEPGLQRIPNPCHRAEPKDCFPKP